MTPNTSFGVDVVGGTNLEVVSVRVDETVVAWIPTFVSSDVFRLVVVMVINWFNGVVRIDDDEGESFLMDGWLSMVGACFVSR